MNLNFMVFIQEIINDGAYVINLDKNESRGTRWISLHVNKNVTYFDSFGVGHIPKKIKNS